MIKDPPYKLKDSYTETTFIVRYGSKKLIDRESVTIYDEKKVGPFCTAKINAGMHVDVWEVTKEVTIKRIT